MCGCLVALAALVSPRLAIFVIWLFGLFDDRMSLAFDAFWMGLLGFLVLPWTTLAWTVAFAPVGGVSGFGWFVVGFAFLADLTTYAGGRSARRP